MTCRPTTIEILRGQTATRMDWRRPRVLTVEEILKIVAVETNFDVTDLKGKNRSKDMVEARHLAMHFIRTKTALTVTRIGRIFNRDHTSILYALDMVPTHYKVEQPYRIKYHGIEWLLDKAASL